ncbi:MAG: apolipoprotein N-acyltransferase, partial [Actinobacteria bacterium]|nr:apolipoprotein N-acyltransferase [Actinomycetota bacterium]
ALVNGIVLHWSSKYVGALPWLLLTLLQAAFYIPVGLIYKKTQSLRWAILVLLICEEVRTRFPFGGFGWTRIAFSQVGSPFLPLVSYGGVLLLSLATLLASLALTRIRLKSLALLLLSIFLVGFLPTNQPGSEKISLAAIQGNTPTVGLEFNGRAKAVFNLHLDTTRRLVAKKYDAIIWPENAVDIDPRNFPEVASRISSLISDLDTPLLAGVVLNQNGAPANASVLYSPNTSENSTYIKRYLTPFGEYMPLRSLAELVSPYAKSVVDFQPGDRFVAHYINGNRLAPIICYEIINDGIVREAALRASGFIVQTNSATFANTPESAQQLAITRIRAVEHSREILSVSTVGISAFIDNNGDVKSQTNENISALLAGDLAMTDAKTFADRLGGVAPLLVLLTTLIFALLDIRRRVTL